MNVNGLAVDDGSASDGLRPIDGELIKLAHWMSHNEAATPKYVTLDAKDLQRHLHHTDRAAFSATASSTG